MDIISVAYKKVALCIATSDTLKQLNNSLKMIEFFRRQYEGIYEDKELFGKLIHYLFKDYESRYNELIIKGYSNE